jgi:GDPmannose 4,6-dehydratase
MTKKALITGITGQDGAYLAKFLLEKGYKVFGLYRRTSSPNIWRLLALDIYNKVVLIPGDMTDMASLLNAITKTEPDEIYNLAAQSFVGTSFEQPLITAEVDGAGVTRLLECIQHINPKIKLYHASTSELYGNSILNSKGQILNEESLLIPASPYAASKLYSHHMIKIYRDAYGLFAVNGILFNHESPLRGLEFVTRKISNAVARIKLGLQKKITLGNLNAKRDWGYASEYIAAMWLMLQQEKPEDFVIATGESHSVIEYLNYACKLVGLNPEAIITHSSKLERPLDVHYLRGDSSKAKKVLGWEPKTSFKELVKIMVNADLERWQSHLEGKILPWDAINDPSTY